MNKPLMTLLTAALLTIAGTAGAAKSTKAQCEQLETQMFGKKGPNTDKRIAECLRDFSKEQVDCMLSAKTMEATQACFPKKK